MSNDWVKDIHDMQTKYKTREWVENNQDETSGALVNTDAEEIVDGLIDLCVVAIGTLDAFGVDPYKAWDEVLKANMQKEVGRKVTRPNPLGVPDLVKPDDWEAPSHKGNYGKFDNIR